MYREHVASLFSITDSFFLINSPPLVAEVLEYFNLTINIFQFSFGLNGVFYFPQSLWGKLGLSDFCSPSRTS